jgi:hypothetical protein
LLDQGAVEPPYRIYTPDYYEIDLDKDGPDPRVGDAILYSAGGPDDFGYSWIDTDEPDGPAFGWVDISATGTAVTGLTDDSYAGPFPIGFEFVFYGSAYTEFYVSSNGLIGFGPPDQYDSHTNKPIPRYGTPDNFIALLWDDLNLLDPDNPGGEVRYELQSNRLVIQYIDFPEYNAEPGDVFNGQIILSDGGMISLHYLDFGPGFDLDNCTVGIESEDAFNGLSVVFNSSYLHDSLCVLIRPPTVGWLAVAPDTGSIDSGDCDTLTVSFTSAGLNPGDYSAEIEIINNDPDPSDDPWTASAELTVEPAYLSGDANGDDGLDIDDAVYLIEFIFSGGAGPEPFDSGDADCSGTVDIDDVVFLIAYIFASGPGPGAGC